MIIVCEQCQTRFQLDDSRIPASGARVRCSRCKHAFRVAHPDASPEDVVEEAIAEASAGAASSAPEPSVDLEHAETGSAASLDDDADVLPDDEEQDWEFNDEPSADGPSPEPSPAVAEASDPDPDPEPEQAEAGADPQPEQAEASPEPREAEADPDPGGAPQEASAETLLASASDHAAELSAEPEQNSSDLELDFSSAAVEDLGESPQASPPSESPQPGAQAQTQAQAQTEASLLEDLGSPEEWDFLGGEAAPGDGPSLAEDALLEGIDAPELGAGEVEAAPDEAASSAAVTSSQAAQGRGIAASALGGRLLRQALQVGSLTLAVALVGAGLVRVTSQAFAPAAAAAHVDRFDVAGGEAREVRVRVVENLSGGRLAVVTGRFFPGRAAVSDPHARIQVEWLADGGPIASSRAVAGVALPESWLREADPTQLQALLEGRAAELVQAREAVPFQAVFASLPGAATGVRLLDQPSPRSEGAVGDRAGAEEAAVQPPGSGDAAHASGAP